MKPGLPKDLADRAGAISLLLMDCDGVLTDGRLYFSEKGEQQKVFHVHDGQGITLWHAAGLRTGIVSGRTSKALEARASELGVAFVEQGVSDKEQAVMSILEVARVDASEAAFIGDDIGDLPGFAAAGLSFAVANAASEVAAQADFITSAKGGEGAVREVIDLILQARRSRD